VERGIDVELIVGRRPTWIALACAVLFGVATMQGVYGISLLSDGGSRGAFGDDLVWWGFIELVLAALAFFGALRLFRGHKLGRPIGYAWAILALLTSLLALGLVTRWAIATIALAVLVIYALAETEESRSL
jgi:hypothetical protein